MAMYHQLVSETGSGFRKTRRAIKRHTAKKLRRMGKRFLDDAPIRITKERL